MESTNINCKQLAESLDAFRDKELPPDEQAQVESHLQTCTNCLHELARINKVVDALQSVPREALSAESTTRLDALLDRQSKVVRLQPKVWAPIAVAAAVAAVAVGLRIGSPMPSTGPVVAEKPTPLSTPLQTIKKNPRPAPEIANNTSEKPVVQPRRQTEQPAAQRPIVAEKPQPTTLHVGQKQPSSNLGTTLASKPPAKLHNSPATSGKSAPDSSLIASRPTSGSSPIPQGTNDVAIVADESVPSDFSSRNSVTDAMGISTDEDGLYDIKM